MNHFLLVSLFLIFSSCTSLKNVKKEILQEKDLIGSWKGDNGSTLTIYCTGVMSYTIKSWYFPIGPWTNSGSGDFISSVGEQEFKVQPFGRTWNVDHWPTREDKDRVTMVVDGRKWVRTTNDPCL